MSTSISPLAGLTILDLSQGIAGPGSAMLCARWGADVIKIEPVDGDWIRMLGARDGEMSASTVPYNTGKRSLAVDLKSPRGVELVLALADKSDAVVESFRPGVVDRLGLGYDVVRERNPAVVYASVSGFGQTGPYENLPCSDTVAQAFSGLMSVNKGMDGTPHKIDTTIVDAITSLYSFQSIAMHLVSRQQTGQGARLDLSLASASAAIQAPKIVEWEMTKGKPGALNAPAGSYRTANSWIAVTLVKEVQFEILANAVGLPELNDDPRYRTFQSRAENLEPLRAALDAEFIKHDAEYWLDMLKKKGVLCSRINDYGDWLADEQVGFQNFAPATQVTPGLTVPLAAIPGSPPDADISVPRIGEHTTEILESLGLDAAAIDGLISDGVVRQSEN